MKAARVTKQQQLQIIRTSFLKLRVFNVVILSSCQITPQRFIKFREVNVLGSGIFGNNQQVCQLSPPSRNPLFPGFRGPKCVQEAQNLAAIFTVCGSHEYLEMTGKLPGKIDGNDCPSNESTRFVPCFPLSFAYVPTECLQNSGFRCCSRCKIFNQGLPRKPKRCG